MAIRPKIIGPRPIERKVVRPATKPAENPTNTPVTPPAKAPVTPPVNNPVTPPVKTPVTPFVNTPVNPSVNTTVTPPINKPVTPPVNTPVSPLINRTVMPPVSTEKEKPAAKARPVKPVKPKSESNVNSAVVMLSLLVVLLMGGIGYLMYEKLKKPALAEDESGKSEVSKSEVDMELAQINRLQDSIRVIIAQKEALGQELAEERAKLGALEELKNQVRHSQISINSLSKKLNRFKEDYHTVQASMVTMETSNKELVLEKENLQKLLQAKDDSLRALANAQSALHEKVALAAALKTQSVAVTVFNTAGKEMSPAASYKAMVVRKVKVNFTLADNKVTSAGPKDIYMRLLEPSGSTLFEGERIFMVNGRKTFYTDKQTIDFDNSQQTYSFVYSEKSRYKPGKYSVELYSDGQKIGDGNLTLLK
jgi:hypothetical protein